MVMVADIGALNERVTVQYDAGTETNKGGTTEDWQTVTTTWMAVKPMSQGRGEQALESAGVNKYRFIARYREDLQTQNASAPSTTYQTHYQLLWRSREFRIEQVNDMGFKSFFIELIAYEKRP